jgi:predicted ATPase
MTGLTTRPVIERLTIRNYRVLRDVTFDNLTPLTVLFGPNGSGKSTVFDVFAFLHEAFTTNLRRAWDRRNRMGEIRSRGSHGGVEFELKYREKKTSRLVTYRLVIDEADGSPVVAEETLRWTTAPKQGGPKDILKFSRGSGTVYDEQTGRLLDERLDSSDLLAVSTLGQLGRHAQVAALRRFISGWYLSYLSADNTRALPDAGPQERLSTTGDNLPNVIQHLQERHPDQLNKIFRVLGARVPAYLTVLHDPSPAPIIGIEEPENQLHPRLLPLLAEEARTAAGRSQLLVTTHSPYFVDALRPHELWLLYRADDGYARCLRASEVPAVSAMMAEGAQLGSLWMEGYFGAGDPLTEKLAL